MGPGTPPASRKLVRVDVILKRAVIKKLVLREQCKQVLAGFAGGGAITAGPHARRCFQCREPLLQRVSFLLRKIGIDPLVLTVMANLVIVAQHRLQAALVFFRRPTRHKERRLQPIIAEHF